MVMTLAAESCRVCLCTDGKLRDILNVNQDGDETSHDMLLELLGPVYSNLNGKDGVPEKICRSCALSLGLAFQFRQKALQSQEQIAASLKEEQSDNTETVQIVKDEVLGSSEYDYVAELSNSGSTCADAEHQIDENFEQSTLDGQLIDDQGYTEVDFIADGSIDENMVEYDADFLTEDGNGVVQYLGEEECIEFLEAGYEDVENDITFCNELQFFDKKTNKKTVASTATSSKSSPTYAGQQYTCDVCGNHYAKRSRMLEHRRMHDPSRQYSCEMCDQKFTTREKLRKHMFAHTGTRPHKCTQCSRSFYYESVLKSHEAVHEGHRPFKCDQCDKDFAYSHSLAKHKLIHADRKDYRCDFCDKDFRLQHHLKQHEETKMHLNRVQLVTSMNIDIDEY